MKITGLGCSGRIFVELIGRTGEGCIVRSFVVASLSKESGPREAQAAERKSRCPRRNYEGLERGGLRDARLPSLSWRRLR